MLVTLWDYRVKNDMRNSDLELSTKGLVVILFIPNKIISFIKWCEWFKCPSQQKIYTRHTVITNALSRKRIEFLINH